MRDEPPESALPQRQAQRRCRRGQAAEAGDGGGAFDQPERRPSAAERQRCRQIAVAAQRVDRQDAAALPLGIEAGVMRQQIDLGAAQCRRWCRGGRCRRSRRSVLPPCRRTCRASAGGTAPRSGTRRPAGFRVRARPTRSRGSAGGARPARCDIRCSCDRARSARNAASKRLTIGVQPSARLLAWTERSSSGIARSR